MYVKTFFKIQNMHNNTLCSVTQYKTAHTKARKNNRWNSDHFESCITLECEVFLSHLNRFTDWWLTVIQNGLYSIFKSNQMIWKVYCC